MGAKGLGDALYVRAIALHLISKVPVTVYTPWPEVFSDLAVTVKPLSARTLQVDIRHCSYCLHCRLPEVKKTSMFEMACRQAGVLEPVELQVAWEVRNRKLADKVKALAAGRQILAYQPPKVGSSVSANDFESHLGADHFRIRLGCPGVAQDIGASDLDLFGKTAVTDLLDVASLADGFFGEPCYLTTLAQAMDKPFTCLFSSSAATAADSRTRNLTPERFFHKPHLGTALYVD